MRSHLQAAGVGSEGASRATCVTNASSAQAAATLQGSAKGTKRQLREPISIWRYANAC